MKKKVNSKVFMMMAVCFAAMLLSTCTVCNKSQEPQVEQVDLVDFEIIRTELYDHAMTICTGLAECDGSCFYRDVDEEYIEIFRTFRVPSLEVLLGILDQIDDKGSLYDVYDDDWDTLPEYYMWREKYESCF